MGLISHSDYTLNSSNILIKCSVSLKHMEGGGNIAFKILTHTSQPERRKAGIVNYMCGVYRNELRMTGSTSMTLRGSLPRASLETRCLLAERARALEDCASRKAICTKGKGTCYYSRTYWQIALHTTLTRA